MFVIGKSVQPASSNHYKKKSRTKISNFKEWKHVVASIVYFHIGKNVDDLVDQDYYNIYTVGIPPDVMADMVLRKSGF